MVRSQFFFQRVFLVLVAGSSLAPLSLRAQEPQDVTEQKNLQEQGPPSEVPVVDLPSVQAPASVPPSADMPPPSADMPPPSADMPPPSADMPPPQSPPPLPELTQEEKEAQEKKEALMRAEAARAEAEKEVEERKEAEKQARKKKIQDEVEEINKESQKLLMEKTDKEAIAKELEIQMGKVQLIWQENDLSADNFSPDQEKNFVRLRNKFLEEIDDINRKLTRLQNKAKELQNQLPPEDRAGSVEEAPPPPKLNPVKPEGI